MASFYVMIYDWVLTELSIFLALPFLVRSELLLSPLFPLFAYVHYLVRA